MIQSLAERTSPTERPSLAPPTPGQSPSDHRSQPCDETRALERMMRRDRRRRRPLFSCEVERWDDAPANETTVERADETVGHPVTLEADGRRPRPSGNVGIPSTRDAIMQCVKALLPAGWSVRSTAGEGHRGRPVIGGLEAADAVAGVLNWHSNVKPKTAHAYRARCHKLLSAIGRSTCDPERLTARVVVKLAIEIRRRPLRPSSYRQYRCAVSWAAAASLKHAAEDGVASLLAAYLVIDAVKSAGLGDHDCKAAGHPSRRGKTPPGIAKRFPEADQAAIFSHLATSRSARASKLADLLRLLLLTGARPCEVRSMQLSTRGPRISATIESAKWDEDGVRATAKTRTLIFDSVEPDLAKSMLRAVRHARGYDDDGWRREREALQRVLRTVCKSLWPRRKRVYGLYSGRHQCAADWKLAVEGGAEGGNANAPFETDGLTIVAALMGHASDDTATRHYARASVGRKGVRLPMIDAATVATVRRVRPERVARIQHFRSVQPSPKSPQA